MYGDKTWKEFPSSSNILHWEWAKCKRNTGKQQVISDLDKSRLSVEERANSKSDKNVTVVHKKKKKKKKPKLNTVETIFLKP